MPIRPCRAAAQIRSRVAPAAPGLDRFDSIAIRSEEPGAAGPPWLGGGPASYRFVARRSAVASVRFTSARASVSSCIRPVLSLMVGVLLRKAGATAGLPRPPVMGYFLLALCFRRRVAARRRLPFLTARAAARKVTTTVTSCTTAVASWIVSAFITPSFHPAPCGASPVPVVCGWAVKPEECRARCSAAETGEWRHVA